MIHLVERGRPFGSPSLFTTDYLFLCDQDDIRLPGKIKAYSDYLDCKKCDLLFSDSYIYNNDNIHTEQMYRMSNIIGINPQFFDDDSILMKNVVQGATICISRRLAKIVKYNVGRVGVENIVIHDWFIAIIAKYFGVIGYIASPQMLYRQHENNLIGSDYSYYNRFIIFFRSIKQMVNIKSNLLNDIIYIRASTSNVGLIRYLLSKMVIFYFITKRLIDCLAKRR